MRATLSLLSVLVCASALAQVNVVQQPGSLVTATQSPAPASWLLVPKAGQIIKDAGPEWQAWLPPGSYSILGIAADGQILGRTVVVGGGPSPQPGPNPQPGPGPTPDPAPVPGKISAALVCDPSGLAGETAQQVAARASPAAMAYMQAKGYRFRQFVGAPLDAAGEPAASEAFFVSQAAKLGKYPALVIGESGSATPKLVTQVSDSATLLATLQRYGGAPAAKPHAQEALDLSTFKIDVPAPAGVRMGLIPSRKVEAFRFTKLEAAGIPDIPESQWATFYAQQPPTILSQWVWEVMDQDGLGACAAFAATQAVEVAEAVAGLPRKRLAAFCLYSLASYPRDSGSGLDENANNVETVGIPEVEFSPAFADKGGWSNSSRWPAGWQANAAKHRCKVLDLSGNSSAEAWHNLVVMLLRGVPCTIGVDWPGGHSILAVAPVFSGSQVTGILIVNSWGADWNGDGRTIRSKANVIDGIETFGGPFAYVVPTFPQDLKAEPAAAPCPSGNCPSR